ncbi:MAG TPA: cyclic nucleotide-binding and patatin-like phospholipase domain-containing protein [Vicinamibacterales bacterium]|nr:cyclic nucleotide-binding and patatin-like phospholipase domain-containing protein [Vicinamibacterales bacterium]
MATDPKSVPTPFDVLRSITAFSAIPDAALCELAAEMSGLVLAGDQTLIRQNDAGTTLCIVISGVLGVTWLDGSGVEHLLPDILPGGTVGEVSVLSDTPALATVRARGTVHLLQLSRAAFDRFATRSPVGALALIDALRPQLHRHALRFALHRTTTFRDLDPQLLTDLESELETVSLYGGEVLLRAGDPGDSVYVVISGRLRVVRRASHDVETGLAELGPGETVGEMALIAGERRSADVYAVRDTHLARLSRQAIERLLVRHPMATLLMLARGPVSRVRRMSSGGPPVAPIATIAIVPAGPGAPHGLQAFGEQLSQSLSRLGTTLHVTSAFIDARLGREGAAQAFDRHGGGSGVLEWLAEQELEHRFVVYQSDPRLTPWTERTIRQADHVVVVADAAGDPHPGEIERDCLDQRSGRPLRRTLALVHQHGATPSNTARWLSSRPAIDRHLHLRLDEPGDFDRVARLLTGQAVGLVLGGGFARGLAHVGVLQALRERDIPLDLIGGSSMGAMIAAQHLLGWDGDRILDEISTAFAKSFDDMTIPFLAFKRGGKYSRLVQQFFGDARIEDLWLPYFCTSSNLNRADLKIHTTGPLASALLATTRAPGIYPPVVIDGELHVDGGLINNVPVDVMKTFSNQGIVIGVDVSPPHELKPVVDYGDDISGWQAMWNRFSPTRDKRRFRPSLLLVLMRLIEFGGISYRRQNASHADVYVSPDLLRFKRNDFHAAREIRDVGYAAARASLDAWVAGRSRGERDSVKHDEPPPPLRGAVRTERVEADSTRGTGDGPLIRTA